MDEIDESGGLVRAEFGRLLRPRRRPARPVGGSAARARQSRRLVLAIALLVVATIQIDVGSATPGAAPDRHPAAQGSAAQPSPDPYEPEVPRVREPVRGPEQRTAPSASSGGTTTTSSPPVTYDSSSTPTERISTPATGTEPRQKTQKPKKANTTTKPSTGQRVVNQLAPRSAPAVAAASLEGRPLLFGGLGMVALALASGSLLFLVSRTGGWETRT